MDAFGVPTELEQMYQPILKRADKLGYGQTTTETHPELLVNALTAQANNELGIAKLKTDTELQISQIQSNNAIAQSHLQLERDKFEYMKEANTPSFGEKLMGLATGALQGFVAGKNFSTSSSNPNGTGTGEAIGAIAGGALAFAGSSGTRAGQQNTMGMLNDVATLSDTYKKSQQASIASDASKSLTDMLTGLHKQATGVSGTPIDPQHPNNASLSNPQPGGGVDNATAFQQRQTALNAYRDKLAPIIGFDAAQKRRDAYDKTTMDPTNALENPDHFKEARVASRLSQYEALSNPSPMDYAHLKNDLQGFELHDAITKGTASSEALSRWDADRKALSAGQLPSAPSVVPAARANATQEPGVVRPHAIQPSPPPVHESHPLEIEALDSHGNTIGTVTPQAAAPEQSLAPTGPVPTSQDLAKQGEQTVAEMEKLRQPMGFWDRGSQGMPFGIETKAAKNNRLIDEAEKTVKEGKQTQADAPNQVDLESKLTSLRQGNTIANRAAENPGVKEDRESTINELYSKREQVTKNMPEDDKSQRNEKKGMQRVIESSKSLSDVMEKMPDDLAQRASSFFKDHPILSSPHFKSDFLDAITKEAGREGSKVSFTPQERDAIIDYQKHMRDLAYGDALIDAGDRAPREDAIKESMKDVPSLDDDYRTRSRKLETLAKGYLEDIQDRAGTAGANKKSDLNLEHLKMRNAQDAIKLHNLRAGGAAVSHDLFGNAIVKGKGSRSVPFTSAGFSSTDPDTDEGDE